MAEEAVVAASIDPIVPEQGDHSEQENAQQKDSEETPASVSPPKETEPQSEAEKKPTPKKYKVKVDDEESEVDEDELVKGYQKSKAGDKRLREAAKMQKQITQLLQNLKSGDHNNIVKLLGKEQAKKMAEKLLLEEIEYEELPEHEKTIRQLQKEKQELEQKQQQEAEQRQIVERKRLEKQAADELQTDVMSAIKDAEIKPNKLVMRGMVDIMRAYHTETKQRLPAKEAMDYVNGALPKEIAEYIGALPSTKRLEFKKLLPKEVLEAFRQDDVQSVLSQTSVGSSGTIDKPSTPRKPKAQDRRMTTDDWFNKMEKRLSGG